ncbi:hypothetical protein RJT34_17569 [Clitoria ternatea]|uniref:Glycosyl transferase CAP10 domain-containing protein n=1 Tax=Clitoria ternatea TaxID=43366 RepID=A0AAN9PEN1_CLITE
MISLQEVWYLGNTIGPSEAPTKACAAEQIGKAGTRFIYENLKMNFVYDYMLHVLTEYAKLLRFKPTIPAGAVEVCSENMACPMYGIWRQYLVDSMVKSPSATPLCTMSSPYDEEEAEE